MYVADTMKRLNDAQVGKARAEVSSGDADCDYCNDRKAEFVIPVYNPADSVRDVEGAYDLINLCQDCLDDGCYLEEKFYCEECQELFVRNHSWDSLVCVIDGHEFCHKCAIQFMEEKPLSEVLNDLRINGDGSGWYRIEDIPNREEIYSCEFSEWSDFPGITSVDDLIDDITSKVKDQSQLVIPAIIKTYQFSLVLSIFA